LKDFLTDSGLAATLLYLYGQSAGCDLMRWLPQETTMWLIILPK